MAWPVTRPGSGDGRRPTSARGGLRRRLTPAGKIPAVPTKTWQVRRAGRVATWCLVSIYGLVTTISIVGEVAAESSGGRTTGFVSAVLFGFLLVSTYRQGIRPRIEARESDLLVVNPWTTYRVAWSDIEELVPGYRGITIRRRSGPPVEAWAAQKSNLATALNEGTRADEIAEEIAQLAGRHGAHSDDGSLTPTATEKAIRSRNTWKVVIVGLAAATAWTVLRQVAGH